MVEEILRDVAIADPHRRIRFRRYLNPVGAHKSGLIGEDPNSIPNNLMPFISRVAAGRLERLAVFENDYGTSDGTGVRDYIYGVDLAQGHAAALEVLGAMDDPVATWNLETGQGYSVLEMIAAFERANGVSVPNAITRRRPGDVAACYASAIEASAGMDWEDTRGLDDMVASLWLFEEMPTERAAA